MQQKKQDIVEEARAIIRALDGKKSPVKKRSVSGFLPLVYGAIGFLSATVLSFLLRVSLFR